MPRRRERYRRRLPLRFSQPEQLLQETVYVGGLSPIPHMPTASQHPDWSG